MATTTFRSRARVIDLLGRQQIADTPTAISELLKNALDASARSVVVNYLKELDGLIIKDDGLGMRTSDVLDKWLVIATESKNKKLEKNSEWLKHADADQRQWQQLPKYGEKGIGRLSIAALGRVVLLWTVWGKGEDMTGTLCLVHWNLFRHPTKLFEDLPIPYISFNTQPSRTDFFSFIDDFLTDSRVLNLLADKEWEEDLKDEIVHDIQCIKSTTEFYDSIKWETGTTFIISGLAQGINDLFSSSIHTDGSENMDTARVKAYNTFSGFWDPFHPHPDRDFKVIPLVNSKAITQTREFWRPDDFENTDHHITIHVDTNGFAKGVLSGYGKKPATYMRQLPQMPKGAQAPGPFTVEIGYLEGQQSNSVVPKDLHTDINERLVYAGGFAVYVNNVRIQPYGTPESDFVGFEARRLKNVGRYFFSSVRMFGGVFITSHEKMKLKEKAGREGFIVNAASKGLRFWLEALFIDLADSHYGTKAPNRTRAAHKWSKRTKEAAKKIDETKKEFIVNCKNSWSKIKSNQLDIRKLINTAKQHIANAINETPGSSLEKCEEYHNRLLSELKALRDMPSSIPPGVIINDDALYQIELFFSERINLIHILEKAANSGAASLHILHSKRNSIEEQERRLVQRADDAFNEIKSWIDAAMTPALQKSKDINSELNVLIRTYLSELKETRDLILQGITAKDVVRNSDGEYAQLWEKAIQKQYEFYETNLKPRIERVNENAQNLTNETGRIVYFDDLAYQYQAMKEENTFLIEMAQVGLVFETSSHEYNSHVTTIKKQISLLKAQATPETESIINTLEQAFYIIDERIALYDPLIRKKGKQPADITGADIRNFINNRLSKNLKDITLEMSAACMNYTWSNVKWPVFLGAIYNIVHNATYWSKKGLAPFKIRFNIINDSLVISNSGPPVPETEEKRIFQAGFSRKPYGRGLGLYIAKESLKGIGYKLEYEPFINPEEPSFTITRIIHG